MPDSSNFAPPELGPLNVAPRRSHPMHADDHWASSHWYEAPREDPADEVCFYSSSTARAWSLHVYRDGLHPETVHLAADLPGEFVAAPKDAYRRGCGWPVRHRWRLPDDMLSGFYR